MINVCPVMWPASLSEERKTAADAMSSGVPIFGSAIVEVTRRIALTSFSLSDVRGTMVQPGQMQFTRPPQYPRVVGAILEISFFRERVRPKAIADFAAA
jgi:hypothetical protein